MELSEEMAAVAVDLLLEFGYAAPLRRAERAQFDPVDSEVFGPAPTDSIIQIADLSLTSAYARTSSVQTGDRLIVADAQREPLMTDLVVLDGAEWPIAKIDAARVQGVAVAYFLTLRK